MKKFKYQITSIKEMVWSENAMTYDTEEEAAEAAKELLGRWFGADMARVVPVETPNREAVDYADPKIVINYRSK